MEPTQLETDSICVICEGLEKTEVPDGFVIFKAETEKVHYLNPSAAVIFELSDGRKNIGEIAEFMREVYKLPEAPLAQTLTCTQALIDQGLLRQCLK